MTVILILVAIVLVLALAGLFIEVCRGNLCITLWWCFGGAGQMVEVLFKVIAEIGSCLTSE